MLLKSSLVLIFLLIFSCQPVELIQPVEINNSEFEKISINAKEVSIKIDYKPIFSEENIEDQLKNTPLERLISWNQENISNFGNDNTFIINIIDASIKKREIENQDAKKYEEQTIFQYEIFLLVQYEIYDNSNYLIANTTVESSRSTTSQKYISLNEKEIIINDLMRNTLKDFTKESIIQLSDYMSDYIIN